jgi:anti-sigma B factor antagonist
VLAPIVRASTDEGATAAMDLGLDVQERDGFAVLAVSGEVDVATVPRLREQLHGLVAQGSNQIIVNLDAVDFLDSTGLGVLVGALKRVRSNDGDLYLVCTQPRIRKVFEVTGLTKVFQLFDTVDDAVAGAGAAS